MIERFFLRRMLRRLEARIGLEFDKNLSRRIDAVRYLLEADQ